MNPLSTRPNRWRPITVFNLLVGLLFSLSALGQPAFLTNGLVAYYPFNGNANDESGNKNDFLIDEKILDSDRFGKQNSSILIDQNQSLFIHNPTNFPFGGSPRTFSAWIKPRYTNKAEPYQVIFGYGDPGSYYGAISAFLQYSGNNTYGFHFGMGPGRPNQSDRYVASPRYWDFQKWHHIVWTYSQTNGASFYLDGSQIPITLAIGKTNIINTGISSFRIGGSDGYGLNGEMDELRIYNKELSASEILVLNNYESTLPGRPLRSLATTQPVNGFITTITVLEKGSGYTVEPSVRISGGGGTGASARAILVGGVVEKIVVINPGKNYSTPPLISIEAPTSDPIVSKAISEISGGFVVGATIKDGGYGYTSAPKVNLVGGGGSGALAVAVVFNGVISDIVITNPGIGYASPPLVLIEPPPHTTALSIATSKVKITLTVLQGAKYNIETTDGISEWVPLGESFIATDSTLEREVEVVNDFKYFRLKQSQ